MLFQFTFFSLSARTTTPKKFLLLFYHPSMRRRAAFGAEIAEFFWMNLLFFWIMWMVFFLQD